MYKHIYTNKYSKEEVKRELDIIFSNIFIRISKSEEDVKKEK